MSEDYIIDGVIKALQGYGHALTQERANFLFPNAPRYLILSDVKHDLMGTRKLELQRSFHRIVQPFLTTGSSYFVSMPQRRVPHRIERLNNMPEPTWVEFPLTHVWWPTQLGMHPIQKIAGGALLRQKNSQTIAATIAISPFKYREHLQLRLSPKAAESYIAKFHPRNAKLLESGAILNSDKSFLFVSGIDVSLFGALSEQQSQAFLLVPDVDNRYVVIDMTAQFIASMHRKYVNKDSNAEPEFEFKGKFMEFQVIAQRAVQVSSMLNENTIVAQRANGFPKGNSHYAKLEC